MTTSGWLWRRRGVLLDDPEPRLGRLQVHHVLVHLWRVNWAMIIIVNIVIIISAVDPRGDTIPLFQYLIPDLESPKGLKTTFWSWSIWIRGSELWSSTSIDVTIVIPICFESVQCPAAPNKHGWVELGCNLYEESYPTMFTRCCQTLYRGGRPIIC